jgi:hypothetical protein
MIPEKELDRFLKRLHCQSGGSLIFLQLKLASGDLDYGVCHLLRFQDGLDLLLKGITLFSSVNDLLL